MTIKCCVPGCEVTQISGADSVLHSFPNPNKDLKRFLAWVFAIGGEIVGLSNDYILRNRRVCHNHFEDKYICRNNRLSNIAIPTLNLQGLSSVPQQLMESISMDHTPLQAFGNLSPKASTSKGVVSVSQQPMDSTSSDLTPLCSIENLPPKASTSKGVHCMPQPLTDSTFLGLTTPLCSIEKLPPRASTSKDTPTKQGNQSMPRKFTKCVQMTKNEKLLYQKLAHLKIKLNKCRKHARVHAQAFQKASRNVLLNPNFIKLTENFTSSAKFLTMMQFREAKKGPKGRRFQMEEKLTALCILKQSPKCYRFLRKIFVLPSPLTLNKMINEANLKPGINDSIFDQLKDRVTRLKEPEKVCIVMFDEMAIKPNITYNEKKDRITGFVDTGSTSQKIFADHCLVFMVRGLFKRYKQPLSYTFCTGATKGPQLAVQIKQIITHLQDVGLIPVATVCDQGTNNQSAIKYLLEESKRASEKGGEQNKHNIFKVNGKTIIPLFDPPHLLKGIRNNLLKKPLMYEFDKNIGIAKWSHIEMLYKENPAYKGLRLIPRLTENHVVPSKIAKMKVKYASQVFSATVSSNMGYLAEKGILPEECKETADLLLFFDRLFDSVNGTYGKRGKHGKPLLKPVKPNSCHYKTWQEARRNLKTMKFVDKKGRRGCVPSIHNWIFTIEGCELLAKKLEVEYNITSLYMRNINQDPLENFFGQVRSHGFRDTNPTAVTFESAFACLLINNLINTHVVGANCEEDMCTTLFRLVATNDRANPDPIHNINIDHCNIEFTPLEIKQKNPKIIGPLSYVAGYFAAQIKKRIFRNCEQCNRAIFSTSLHCSQNREITLDYITHKEYHPGWLTKPSLDMLGIVSKIQDVVCQVLIDDIEKEHIKQYMKTIILVNVNFNNIPLCEDHSELIKKCFLNITSRFFIYNYCKDINKILDGRRDVENINDPLQTLAKKCFATRLKKKK